MSIPRFGGRPGHRRGRGLRRAVLGTIREVLTPPAHEVYVVQEEGREYLIPAVDEFVKEIDVEGGQILVHLIEGMESDVSD